MRAVAFGFGAHIPVLQKPRGRRCLKAVPPPPAAPPTARRARPALPLEPELTRPRSLPPSIPAVTSVSLRNRQSSRTRRLNVRTLSLKGELPLPRPRTRPSRKAHQASSQCASGPSTPTAGDPATLFTFARTDALASAFDEVFRLGVHQRDTDAELRRVATDVNTLLDLIEQLRSEQSHLLNTFHNYKLAINERLDFARVVADVTSALPISIGYTPETYRSPAPSPSPSRHFRTFTGVPYSPVTACDAKLEDYDAEDSPRASPFFTPFAPLAAVPIRPERSSTPDLAPVWKPVIKAELTA